MVTQLDPVAQANLVRREVHNAERDGKPTKVVVATRTYRAERADVWDAITNAERLPRWFLPVTGDLRPGGRYQFEGNAGGVVERCEEPHLVAATWEFAGGISWLQVRLHEAPDGTVLELQHEAYVDEHWTTYGPGATGVGWDLALIGLGLHVDTGAAVDPQEFETWTTSPDGASFIGRVSSGWAEAGIGAGEDRDHARAAGARTTAFFTGAEAPGDR